MLQEIKKLLVIQDRDQKISGLEADIQRIPLEEASARSRLASDTTIVANAQEKLTTNEVATKNLELDVQTRQNTIERLKTQQFETRKNEEFRALGHEIERYGEEISSLEDKELELMEEAEKLKAELAGARSRLTKTQEFVDRDLAELVTRKKTAENQIAETRAERATHTDGFDQDLLSLYDRLFAKKKDVAISSVDRGICSGCHMKLTSATNLAVKAEQKVTQCENCGRILYLEQ
ncbi:MAG: C4-type zinc ribbon domain-containing protein [Verrucomicrobiales bacterium]|nr:C4-type zinc ribbon domain-containing protein [Verrucomicrobiales bacterium]